MADVLDAVQKFVNSPPGQVAAGAALAGIVWKFFERVEAVLTDHTKLEIAVWLVGVEVGRKVESWPDTFAKIFDRVFGMEHLSWKCFIRSLVFSFCVASLSWIIAGFFPVISSRPDYPMWKPIVFATWMLLIGNALPDYLSLLGTRWCLRVMERSASTWQWMLCLSIDVAVTLYLAIIARGLVGILLVTLDAWLKGPFPFDTLVWAFRWGVPQIQAVLLPWNAIKALRGMFFIYPTEATIFVLPAFVTSIWLWLYAGSGFLLKFARRFDLGFDLFNRKCDIEKKPLSAIGLVAGALVALCYWGIVIVSRIVHHG